MSSKSNKIAFILDSFSSETQAELLEKGIYYIPLSIFYDGVEFKAGVDINSIEAVKKLEEAKTVTTSQPSQVLMEETFKKLSLTHEHVIFFTINAHLSKTHDSALVVAKNFPNVHVVNSNAPGRSIFPIIEKIKSWANEGMAIEKIIELTHNYMSGCHVLIMIENCKSLVKSGRLKKTSQILLDKFKIHPILYCDLTSLRIKSIRRTLKKSIEKSIEILQDVTKKAYDKFGYGVLYAGNSINGKLGIEALAKSIPKNSIMGEAELCSPVIAAHTGPGLAFYAYLKNL